MIRVVKPATPPTVLATRGVNATARHCADHDAARDEYRAGNRTFTFDHDIYAAPEVKEVLLAAQHAKCAFCESHFAHIAYGDIEHYRPKGRHRQRTGGPERYPGYFWLAYDWSNLFYSCQLCNQRFKQDVFPLRDGRRRAHPGRRDTSKEQPLLIDPATDPTPHLGFREEYAFAVNGSREGETTIEVVGLNREELAEIRRERLEDLRILRRLCEELRVSVNADPTPQRKAELAQYEAELRSRTADTAEYAAMARAFVSSAAGVP